MKPIGPLMWEHRLIERFIEILNAEIGKIREQNAINLIILDQAVDFFRT
jgi:hemerythrin-like domain-containing protein